MLEIIRRGAENRKENIIAHLYKSITLMLLEYFRAVPVCQVLQLEGVRGKAKAMKQVLSVR